MPPIQTARNFNILQYAKRALYVMVFIGAYPHIPDFLQAITLIIFLYLSIEYLLENKQNPNESQIKDLQQAFYDLQTKTNQNQIIKYSIEHLIGLVSNFLVLYSTQNSIKYFLGDISISWVYFLIFLIYIVSLGLISAKKTSSMLLSVFFSNFLILTLSHSLYGIIMKVIIEKSFQSLRKKLKNITVYKFPQKTNLLKTVLSIYVLIGILGIIKFWFQVIGRTKIIFISIASFVFIWILTAIWKKMEIKTLQDFKSARNETITLLCALFVSVFHWKFNPQTWQYWLNAPITLASLSYEIDLFYQIEIIEQLFGGNSPKKFIFRAFAAFIFLLNVQLIKNVFQME